jgi:hypothetical protein
MILFCMNAVKFVDSYPCPNAGRNAVHTYAELQRQIHHDVRTQHPEWIGPNGDSPMCDFERRFAELIEFFQSTESKLAAA